MSISRLRITSRIEVWWTRTSYIDFSTVSGSMPCDMVRLPWGSMSTHSTRWPFSAKATATLSVVVVLATPPFWLANAMTLAWLRSRLAPMRLGETHVRHYSHDRAAIPSRYRRASSGRATVPSRR